MHLCYSDWRNDRTCLAALSDAGGACGDALDASPPNTSSPLYLAAKHPLDLGISFENPMES